VGWRRGGRVGGKRSSSRRRRRGRRGEHERAAGRRDVNRPGGCQDEDEEKEGETKP